MRAIVVIELNVTTTEDVAEALLSIEPPSVPHFAGTVQVAIDPSASTVIDWLNEGGPIG